MKPRILKMTFLVCMASTIITNCDNSVENLNVARLDSVKVFQKAETVGLDSVTEYRNYREKSEAKLIENDIEISKLKLKIKKDKKEVRAEREKQLTDFETKNLALKNRMHQYKHGATDKWESFKLKFNTDMDELATSLSNINENHTKKN